MTIDLGEYVDVATRIAEFRTKHPEGSLQPVDLATPFQLLTIADQTVLVVVAAAYRTPDDPRPGIGMAMELVPGRTPYTRGSELQNCETSAWGRAIVAVLAADTKRGVASADDVRNRRAEREAQQPEPVQETGELVGPRVLQQLGIALAEYGLSDRNVRLEFVAGMVGRNIESSKELTDAEARYVLKTVRQQIAEDKKAEPDGPPADAEFLGG